jgi:saccharopine dehydrogenase-like NADP-dependent oxidoreductase
MKRILVLGGVGAMANETTRDLVATSDFDEITIADIDVKKAKAFASGLKDKRLKVVGFDANKISDMAKLMKGNDVVANGLPRIYSEKAIKAAIAARVNILDLISLEEETLSLDGKAKGAGISVVGGVGITPGITNILAKLGSDRLPQVEQIDIDFAAFRSIAHSPALLHVILWEFDPNTKIRYCFENGKLIPNPPFSGERTVHFPDPIGTQTTYYVPHGESQTLSKSIEGVKRVYIRGTFPPRAMRLVRGLYDYGFYESKPIFYQGKRVPPFDFLRTYLLSVPQGDQTELWGYSVQAEIVGYLKGKKVMVRFQTSHPPMEEWGGTRAYDKNVGIPLSIGAQMLAAGKAKQKGVNGAENMLPAQEFVDELRKRGFRISEEVIDL